MAAAFAAAPVDPVHPKATLRRLAPQLPPLMLVWAEAPSRAMMGATPELAEMLACGRMDPGDADLEVLTRLLLVGLVAEMRGIDQPALGLDVLSMIQPPLFASGASLDRQLAALQRRCGSAGGAQARLPTAAELELVWAGLAIPLACSGSVHMAQAEVAAVVEQAARVQLRRQPDSPRGHFHLGRAAMVYATCEPAPAASAPRDPLPHYLRGAELARQQGSDFWLARCGWSAAMVAAADSSTALSPAAAAALLEEADAAFARMKKVVPPMWRTNAQTEKHMVAPILPSIEKNAQLSPGAWRAAIRQERQGEEQRQMERVLARAEQGNLCDACGLPSAMLKLCSGCGVARYCGRSCQRAAWPAHKAACKGKGRAAT